MASEAVASGVSGEGLTPAQKLMEQHDHHVTVEDVVDEEDLAHPPASAEKSADTPLSEKAAGKQKAEAAPVKKAPALNTASEEAFPALGPVKPRAQAPVAPAWGKKSASAGANGVNGSGAAPSSGASTPASGFSAPSAPIARGPALPSMALPGKHKEQITFHPSQIASRSDLKKPIHELVRDINRRSKAKLELKQGPNAVIFEATGPVEAARQALKDIANEVGSKVRAFPRNLILLLTKPAICQALHPRFGPPLHHRSPRRKDPGNQQTLRRPCPDPQARGRRRGCRD